MARVYADSAAYTAAGYGTAPANIDTLLRQASRVVDALLVGRVYDVDDTGLPTDTDVAQALSDATCAIAAELDATGALVAGGTEQYASVGIGNVSLSGRTSGDTPTVLGVAVPSAAVLALADVGSVYVADDVPRCIRPLDRITP